MAEQTLAQYLAAGCKKYGYQITELEYRALYRAQGGRCYVCRKATGPTKKNPRARRLAVDHDHLTGEVRGLVCSGSLSAMTCNRLIAIYNRAQLLRAAAMLSDPPPARLVLQQVRLALASARPYEPLDEPDPADTVHFIPSLVGNPAFTLTYLGREEL